MDKAEYRMRLDEISALVESEDYEGALEIVESIDWRRVKSVRTLCMVADIYEANSRLEDSMKMLQLALKRSSSGKMILYRQVELSLKMNETDAALKYYNQYLETASNDTSKFILKYKILKAQKAPVEDQIAVLEEYKEREYTERWVYELARLYKKAGMQYKCIEACDDLILWFGEGKYVTKAMELKMTYVPLSAEQKAKYDKIEGTSGAKSAKIAKTAEALADLSATAMTNLNRSVSNEKTEAAPLGMGDAAAANENAATSVLQQTISFDTEKLQERLSKNFQEVLAGFNRTRNVNAFEVIGREKSRNAEEEQVPVENIEEYHVTTLAPEEEETRISAEKGAAIAHRTEISPEQETTPEKTEDQEVVSVEEMDLDALFAETSEALAAAAGGAVSTEAADVQSSGMESASEEIQEEIEEKENTIENTEEPPAEDDAEKAMAAFETSLFDSLNLNPDGTDKLPEKDALEKASMEAFEAGLEASLSLSIDGNDEAEEEAAEQSGAEEVETEQAPEAEFVVEEEPETEQVPEAEFGTEDKSETESVPEAEFAEEESEAELMPETQSGEVAEEEPEFELTLEEQPEVETELTLEAESGAEEEPEFEPVPEEITVASQAESEEEIVFEEPLKIEEAVSADRGAEVPDFEHQPEWNDFGKTRVFDLEKELMAALQEEKQPEEDAKSTETAGTAEPEPAVEEEEPDPIAAMLREAEAEPVAVVEEPEQETPEEKRIRILNATRPERLTKEQKKLFTYFSKVPGMDEQVLEAINGVYLHADEKTSRHGNIAIMGSKGTGKTRLTEGLVKAICKELGLEAAKYANLDAAEMNRKDPAAVIGRMAGGFLLIERAGSMTAETIAKLSQAMDFRTDSMILIIEDEKASMRKLLKDYPEFAKKFETVISIPVFTNDELVTFARTYARENGYRMDEMGVLALYTLIGDNQREDEPITIAKVKDMVDGAIRKASGIKLGRKISKRHMDAEGRILLYEKDFDF